VQHHRRGAERDEGVPGEVLRDGEQEPVGDLDAVVVGPASVQVEPDQLGDVVGTGPGGDGGRIPLLDDPALLHDHQPVGQHQRIEGVVRDQHGGTGVGGQVPVQLDAGIQAGTGVQGGERLVEQQHGRPHRERPGQCHPLRLSAGELPGSPVGVFDQSHPGQPVAGRQPSRPSVGTVPAWAEGHVLERVQVWEEQIVLEDHADRPPLGGDERVPIRPVQVAARHRDVAGGQSLQAGERPQRGRLAGTVRTEQRHHLTGRDPQGHVQPEVSPVHREVRVQQVFGHGVLTHRSRSPARITTETTSRIRLSTIAASTSVSSAR